MEQNSEQSQVGDKPKTALIMEGGAMRGLFTCGVIDVLLENNIEFDGSIGISAGAMFGCNYKSKQIGRGMRYTIKYSRDPRSGTLRSLIKTGDIYEKKLFCHDIPFLLDPLDIETFRANPHKFYVGATDVHTGKAVYHRCDEGDERDFAWMSGSASIPVVAQPVSVDGYEIMDGGVADSVPYAFMESLGYNRNLIVLTRPDNYRKKENHRSPLLKVLMRDYPVLAAAVAARPRAYNRQMEEIKQREEAGISFVIRPPKSLGIRRTEKDPAQLRRVYDIGRAETERVLPQLRAFLEA